ncbi:MAG: DUF2062 domain-containing protein [Deltaproteobacteria bacterium]|jgi:uncharacterized protein (DUF2062 family)/GT2 family glycosyltransferase|nr:DUF2062 domain-containing protein [Deltaproteobacteria bacterium]
MENRRAPLIPSDSALRPLRAVVVVPVYNHGATLRAVVEGVLALHPHVLVVDDGSLDLDGAAEVVPGTEAGPSIPPPACFPPEHPLCGLPAAYLRHGKNRGKGAAIMSGAREAGKYGATHIITIDADGQHSAGDIPAFLRAIAAAPLAVLAGTRDFAARNVPFSSRFGRAFSNFWFRVQTGGALGDTQCGFRAYPLAVLERVPCAERGYSFEVEILVRASWAGFPVGDVPVSVHYPPRGERISHFSALGDNLRIALLNTRLTIRSILPLPRKVYALGEDGGITALRPLRSLRLLLARNETPGKLAASAALGMALGTLPLVGLHSIGIILAAGALRLNKITGLAVSQLCMPPFVPALCIEAGHYLRHGRLLTEFSLRTLGYEAPDRIWEWILGALALSPVFAAAVGCLVYLLAAAVRAGLRGKEGGGP